jgi:hypothetical protein
MMLEKPFTLSSYLTRLLSQGQVVFSGHEAQKALGVARGAFLDAAEKLQRRKHLINPRQNFYIIVPPQYLAWGAPPPTWYIDSLMQHEKRPYYVGLLKAAELHGATHQAVMEFQVITDKRLPEIRVGRTVIAFYHRKDINAVASALEQRKTDTGSMKVSSPELTALDLLRYPHASGGLDHIVTVLAELGGRIEPRKLAALSATFERSVVQRLGHLLGRVGRQERTRLLYESLLLRAPLPWVELEPAEASDAQHGPAPIERDRMWRVIVRRPPQPDE